MDDSDRNLMMTAAHAGYVNKEATLQILNELEAEQLLMRDKAIARLQAIINEGKQ